MLVVKRFEAQNSGFRIIDENNSSSISIPGDGEEPQTFDKLSDSVNVYKNDIKLHGKEATEGGNSIETSDFTHHSANVNIYHLEEGVIEFFKKSKHYDLEDIGF